MKKLIIVSIFLALMVLVGCGCNHQWVDATCTTPMTCSLCGETEGEAEGHVWIDATCVEPKMCLTCKTTDGSPAGHIWVAATCISPRTCELCGEFEGEALGHKLSSVEQTKEPSCSETGLAEGTCDNCGKLLTEELPLLDHTPSEPELVEEATFYTAGTAVVKCTVCESIIEEIAIELTEKEKEDWFKAACEPLAYKEVARTPNAYIGNLAKITGEVFYCIEEASKADDYSIYEVYTKSSFGYYLEDPYYVFIKDFGSDSRILDGDIITFYGEEDGLYSDFGVSQPKLNAFYYELKG